MNKVTKFFRSIPCYLARIGGTRPDAIPLAPMAIALRSTIGALLLLTALNGACSTMYALWVALGSRVIAIGGGLGYGAVIFCLDRALLLTLDKGADWKKRAFQFCLRGPLAAMIGLVLATPLQLAVADSAIQRELFREKQAELKQSSQVYSTTYEVDLKRAISKEAKTDLAAARSRMDGEPDTAQYKRAVPALRAAKDRHAAAAGRVAKARRELFAQDGEDQGLATRVKQLESAAEAERLAVVQAEVELARAAEEFRVTAASAFDTAQAGAINAASRQEVAERAYDGKKEEADNEIRNFSKDDLLNRLRVFWLIRSGNGAEAASASAFARSTELIFIWMELIPLGIAIFSPIDSLDEAELTLIIAEKERCFFMDRIEGNKRLTAAQLQEDLTDRLADGIRRQLDLLLEHANLSSPQVVAEFTETVQRSCAALRGERLDKKSDGDIKAGDVDDVDVDKEQAA